MLRDEKSNIYKCFHLHNLHTNKQTHTRALTTECLDYDKVFVLWTERVFVHDMMLTKCLPHFCAAVLLFVNAKNTIFTLK